MSIQVHLIAKAVHTIKSCKTKEQLEFAMRYCRLLIRRYAKCIRNDTSWDWMEQGFKAAEFAKELDQLYKQQLRVCTEDLLKSCGN